MSIFRSHDYYCWKYFPSEQRANVCLLTSDMKKRRYKSSIEQVLVSKKKICSPLLSFKKIKAKLFICALIGGIWSPRMMRSYHYFPFVCNYQWWRWWSWSDDLDLMVTIKFPSLLFLHRSITEHIGHRVRVLDHDHGRQQLVGITIYAIDWMPPRAMLQKFCLKILPEMVFSTTKIYFG